MKSRQRREESGRRAGENRRTDACVEGVQFAKLVRRPDYCFADAMHRVGMAEPLLCGTDGDGGDVKTPHRLRTHQGSADCHSVRRRSGRSDIGCARRMRYHRQWSRDTIGAQDDTHPRPQITRFALELEVGVATVSPPLCSSLDLLAGDVSVEVSVESLHADVSPRAGVDPAIEATKLRQAGLKRDVVARSTRVEVGVVQIDHELANPVRRRRSARCERRRVRRQWIL